MLSGYRDNTGKNSAGEASAMISEKLSDFCDGVLARGRIDAEDVHQIALDVLPDGPACREDADMLIALDRAVPSVPAWGDYLVSAVVDFAVWTQRPTGVVDAEAARWLADSLSCGAGPTANGARVAFETVREAHRVDDALMAFTLDANRRTRGTIEVMPALPARAA
jgi:hypothetical protein